MASISRCPYSSSSSSVNSEYVAKSRIVPANEHPNYEALKREFENTYGFFDKVNNTLMALNNQGKGFKEQAGLGKILASTKHPGEYSETKTFRATYLDSVLVTDPEIAGEVLKHHRNEEGEDAFFTLSHSFQIVLQILGTESLITASDTSYKKLRLFADQFFNFKTVKSKYLDKLLKSSSNLIKSWTQTDPEQVVITKDLIHFSRNNITQMILGSEASSCELSSAIESMVTIATKRIIGIPEFYHRSEFNQANEIVNAYVRSLMEQEGSEGILKQMANSKDETGASHFTFEEMTSMCKLMIVAGQDTTGNVLNALIYELGKQPALQEELYSDYFAHHCDIADFALNSVVLGKFIQEGLRLYPAVYALSRKTKQDIIIADRCYVPKGWGIDILNVYMNRDIRRWSESPHEFDPHRSRKGNHQGSYVFGGGANPCLGRHFAVMTMRTFLALLVSQYVWKTTNEHDVDFTAKLTIRLMEDVSISLTPRWKILPDPAV